MDLDTLKAISEIVGGLTTQAVLLYWVFVERKRFETIFEALIGDWERQRQREVDIQAKREMNGTGI
jgi:hypothetical protein